MKLQEIIKLLREASSEVERKYKARIKGIFGSLKTLSIYERSKTLFKGYFRCDVCNREVCRRS